VTSVTASMVRNIRTVSGRVPRPTTVRADALKGLITNPRGGERLLGDYADQWLEHRLVKGRALTPATRQGYEALLRRNIRPTEKCL